MNVCAPCVCLSACEGQKRHQMPWNWSCSFELQCGCQESNPDPVEEQALLLVAQLPLLPLHASPERSISSRLTSQQGPLVTPPPLHSQCWG